MVLMHLNSHTHCMEIFRTPILRALVLRYLSSNHAIGFLRAH